MKVPGAKSWFGSSVIVDIKDQTCEASDPHPRNTDEQQKR